MKSTTTIAIATAVLVPLAVVALTRRKSTEPETPGPDDLDPNTPPDDDPGENDGGDVVPVNKAGKPIAVGEATDPSIAPHIASLTTTFINRGVNTKRVTPFSLIVMTKAPVTDGPDPDDDKTRPVAIPPLEMWDGLAEVSSVVSQVISQSLSDLDLRTTGYRPKDYNAAVGGAPKSRHIYGDAIDVWLGHKLLSNGSSAQIKEARERLRMAFARYIVTHKTAPYGFGFGVYTNDIHIDIGRGKGKVVTWADGEKYIKKAKKEQGIA